jgi:hypothetical protein
MSDNPHGQKFPKQQIYSQADMDEAKAAAHAEGYANGVRKVLALEPSYRRWISRFAIEALLPPDNGKGSDA